MISKRQEATGRAAGQPSPRLASLRESDQATRLDGRPTPDRLSRRPSRPTTSRRRGQRGWGIVSGRRRGGPPPWSTLATQRAGTPAERPSDSSWRVAPCGRPGLSPSSSKATSNRPPSPSPLISNLCSSEREEERIPAHRQFVALARAGSLARLPSQTALPNKQATKDSHFGSRRSSGSLVHGSRSAYVRASEREERRMFSSDRGRQG